MDSKELKSHIDSCIADFHAIYMDHTDDLSQAVTYEQLDNVVSGLEEAIKECFFSIIDAQNK